MWLLSRPCTSLRAEQDACLPITIRNSWSTNNGSSRQKFVPAFIATAVGADAGQPESKRYSTPDWQRGLIGQYDIRCPSVRQQPYRASAEFRAIACIAALAAMHGCRSRRAAAKDLLEGGHADPNAAATAPGKTPLVLAAEQGHDAVLALLIEKQVSQQNKDMALRAAAFAGQLGSMKLLLAHGAGVNAQSDSGFSPLMMAVSANQSEAAWALISAGADCVQFASGPRGLRVQRFH